MSVGSSWAYADENLDNLVEKIKSTQGAERRACLLKAASFGRQAVPVLIGFLENSEENIQDGAADALGTIGPEAAEAVPALTAALEKADRHLRQCEMERKGATLFEEALRRIVNDKEKVRALLAGIREVEDPLSDMGFDQTHRSEILSVMKGDLDQDGREDIAIGPERFRGRAGCNFTVYLKKDNGKYQYVGALFCYPGILAIRRSSAGVGIGKTYIRNGGNSGAFTEYEIAMNGIRLVSERDTNLNEEPGKKEYDSLLKAAESSVRLEKVGGQ